MTGEGRLHRGAISDRSADNGVRPRAPHQSPLRYGRTPAASAQKSGRPAPTTRSAETACVALRFPRLSRPAASA
jgi:hypothetical protein